MIFMSNPTIINGLREEHRGKAAHAFWEAFQAKLRIPMGPPEKAISFLESTLNPHCAISAVSPEGELLGVAGYKLANGAFVEGDWSDLVKTYGFLSAAWRAPLLALLERDVALGVLLMDGIFVLPEARSQGVGGALLEAVCAAADDMDLTSVRLDVIDKNRRARALYERHGFVAGKTENIGPLRHVFGFKCATTMFKAINQ